VSVAADLGQLLRQRELSAYEERMARALYAYGVDLRRAAWLSTSQVARPLVAGVARAWPRLVRRLTEAVLAPPEAVPGALLEAVAAGAERLRTPIPAVRVVREGAAMPGVLPLGTLHGAVSWLVFDPAAFDELGPAERAFVVGHGLGHLQCDHGILFTAHLAAAGRAVPRWTTRRLLGPFTKVAPFSADRAGHLLALDLTAARTALAWIERTGRRMAGWPRFPSIDLRLEALADFDRSAIVSATRRRAAGEDDARAEVPPRDALPGWSLARCDARLTRRLGLP